MDVYLKICTRIKFFYICVYYAERDDRICLQLNRYQLKNKQGHVGIQTVFYFKNSNKDYTFGRIMTRHITRFCYLKLQLTYKLK